MLLLLAAGRPDARGESRTNVDLGGTWQYQIVANTVYPPPANWLNITVPGYLSSTNYASAWFRKVFTLPALPAGWRVKIQFGGVKYRSTVYVNGQAVGGCYNGYDAFELDATEAALPQQQNELLVSATDWTGLFSSPVDFSNLQPGEQSRDRPNNVVLAPIGGHYSLFGIWEPVTISYVPGTSVGDVYVRPSVRQQRLVAHATIRNDTGTPIAGTLRSRVLEGTTQVLLLPDMAVSVPAGSAVDVETNAAWETPKLWSPEDPHLYTLESVLISGTVAADTVQTRFGFREFWTLGDSFFLNGTKVHLLATSCWPPTSPVSDSAVRTALLQVKAGNNKAIRLHTQPWPEVWYRVADEVGLLIVEEAAVWCDPRAYRLSDPVFWAHYGDHLRAVVRRDANHPSIILWSLENEILHCGGDGIFSGTPTNLAQLGLLVKALDPTRPITFEADLDPGGVADVLGLHYPHEFPDNAFWPNTAYWMDQPLSKSYAPGGSWKWDRQKPLYIGEYLWIPDSAAEGFTILFGDAAYFDPARSRLLAKAQTWQMQIEAYRAYGVSAHCPWTMVEDPAASGVENLQPDRNLLYQTEARAYQPNAAVIKEYDRHFFTSEVVSRTVTVYNDTAGNADYVLRWNAGGSTGSRNVRLSPGEQKVETFQFTVPGQPGLFNLEWELQRQGATVFTNVLSCGAFAPLSLTFPNERRVGLYDPAGLTSPLLAGLSWLAVTNLATAPYEGMDLLIIGRDALQPETVPTVGAGSTVGRWQTFMESGGWIIVLEQSYYPPWLPLGVGLAQEPASYAFPVAEHPLVAGLGEQDFRWWRGDHAVARAPVRMPTRGNFRPVIHVGSVQGLDRAALLELPVNRGGMLCSQLLLSERFTSEPLAQIMLQRLLNYSGKSAPRCAGLLAEPDSPAAQALQRAGLVCENLSGQLSKQDLNRFPVLILAGTNAGWNEALANFAKLRTYVETGGRLVVHRPTDAFLAMAGPVFLPSASWTTNVGFPILRSDPAKPPRSFSNADLYWADDPGSWNRPLQLATNVATRIYRKDFALSSYTVLQVENMPVKTTGSAVTGGWNLYANGYVAQNITVTIPGSYLFGVVARGTPLGGIYPHMVLRIDGVFADAVTVSSTSYQMFTLSAQLSTGTHELALVFDNDAYAPPEDRNLILDQVRYGTDPQPDVPDFVTKPGALVEARLGAGTALFDEISWEAAGKHATKAERYLCSLLTEQGAWMRVPAALTIQAENMLPVGVSSISTNAGIVWLNSAGRLQSSVRFAESGTFQFEICGYGTPASNVYPKAELRIDGVSRGSVELAATAAGIFTLTAAIASGVHVVAVAFTNDFYAPPQDRNMALDYITIQPQARPRFIDLYVPASHDRAVLAWLAEAGRSYQMQFTPSLDGPWTNVGAATAIGSVGSWEDDGVAIGAPPFTSSRTSGFYRVLRLP